MVSGPPTAASHDARHPLDPHPLDPYSGRVLGERYTLLHRIARGGTSEVYSAEHRNGRRVAVKILTREFATDPRARAHFIQEGRAANLVKHPGVLQIFDDGETEDGSLFIVSELLTGETLAEYVTRHPGGLPTTEVVALLIQALTTLSEVHTQGVVHRDIKPSNWFRCTNGTLKLLDFGLARLPEDSMQHAPGDVIGTPAYMSPEQARGEWTQVDAQSDIWSLAATAMTLLTGMLPRKERSIEAMLTAAATEPAPKLLEVSPATLPWLRNVLDRALATRRADRFASAAHFLTALRHGNRARKRRLTGALLALAFVSSCAVTLALRHFFAADRSALPVASQQTLAPENMPAAQVSSPGEGTAIPLHSAPFDAGVPDAGVPNAGMQASAGGLHATKPRSGPSSSEVKAPSKPTSDPSVKTPVNHDPLERRD